MFLPFKNFLMNVPYKVSWILTLRDITKHQNLAHAHNFRQYEFSLINIAIALQKLPNERSYKFSCILTLTEVISIKILRMRLVSAIMNFYWFHTIALQKLSNERSYRFSWILTLTEVISIRSLRMSLISAIMNVYWSHIIALQKLCNWTL